MCLSQQPKDKILQKTKPLAKRSNIIKKVRNWIDVYTYKHDIVQHRCVCVCLSKSCHSAAIITTPSGGYFGTTRPGPHLNERGESQNFTLNGHRDIKSNLLDKFCDFAPQKTFILLLPMHTLPQHQSLLWLNIRATLHKQYLNKCKFNVSSVNNFTFPGNISELAWYSLLHAY